MLGARKEWVRGLVALAATFLPAYARAQSPAPDAGVIQKEFEKPRAPLSVGGAPASVTAPQEAPPGAAAIRFTLNRLSFDGEHRLTEDELQALAADIVGREISVADLYALAAKITRLYAEGGFALSVAIVPVQQITDGAARIEIIEGFVADVEITGDPGAARGLLLSYGEKIKRDKPLRAVTLERYMLLANDIPGLNVRAIFDSNPAESGAVKLLIEANPWRYDLAGGVNNRGSRVLGRTRGVVSAGENGVLTGRERIGVDMVQTFDIHEVAYVGGRASYVLNAEGSSVALAATYTHAEPGGALLAALDFVSEGWTARAELEHPLIRSRARNLRLIAGFESKSLDSDFGPIVNSRDRLRVFYGSAIFDFQDASSATTQIDLSVRQGVDILGATDFGDLEKSRADASGEFTTLSGGVNRLQPIGSGIELYAAAAGQAASRSLLASEECGYGGGTFGRAFDNYELAGEHCVYALAEFRYTRALGSSKSRAQPYAYYDAGSVWQRGAILPGEKRQRTGQSAGAGVRFWFGDHLYADVEYSQPLTRDVALEGDDDGRIFFTIWAAR